MSVTKNIAFTLLIKINGRLREFNFRKRGETYYDGDTNDERGTRYFFKLEKDNENRKLTGPALPSWLTESESLINEAIITQEQS
jgi:hypothetical protein